MIPFSKYVSASEKENHSYLPILTLISNYLEVLRENGALEISKKKKRYHLSFSEVFFKRFVKISRKLVHKNSQRLLLLFLIPAFIE